MYHKLKPNVGKYFICGASAIYIYTYIINQPTTNGNRLMTVMKLLVSYLLVWPLVYQSTAMKYGSHHLNLRH